MVTLRCSIISYVWIVYLIAFLYIKTKLTINFSEICVFMSHATQ